MPHLTRSLTTGMAVKPSLKMSTRLWNKKHSGFGNQHCTIVFQLHTIHTLSMGGEERACLRKQGATSAGFTWPLYISLGNTNGCNWILDRHFMTCFVPA